MFLKFFWPFYFDSFFHKTLVLNMSTMSSANVEVHFGKSHSPIWCRLFKVWNLTFIQSCFPLHFPVLSRSIRTEFRPRYNLSTVKVLGTNFDAILELKKIRQHFGRTEIVNTHSIWLTPTVVCIECEQEGMFVYICCHFRLKCSNPERSEIKKVFVWFLGNFNLTFFGMTNCIKTILLRNSYADRFGKVINRKKVVKFARRVPKLKISYFWQQASRRHLGTVEKSKE